MKILILGFGKTGQAVYNFLSKYDYYLGVYDQNYLELENAKYYSIDDLKNELPLFDICIRSPGIKRTSEVYHLGEILSKKVVSEIEFSLNFLKTKHIVGVTGSNGKTTTCQMIKTILDEKYHTFLLGNIGVPLISYVESIKEEDILILELSSFILENTISLPCEVVVYTSLSENHLDGVENLSIYYGSKKRLLFQKPSLLISDSSTQEIFHLNQNSSNYLGDYKFNLSKVNQKNLNHAIEVANYYHLSHEQIQEGINKIKIDHYRQEIIFRSRLFVFVNDSKSTSVEATNSCIDQFEDDKKILILSGVFKSDGVSKFHLSKVSKVYVYGQMTNLFSNNVIKMSSLKEILLDIKNTIKEENVILFSPGGSSFDLYKSYQERGEDFNILVEKIWKSELENIK